MKNFSLPSANKNNNLYSNKWIIDFINSKKKDENEIEITKQSNKKNKKRLFGVNALNCADTLSSKHNIIWSLGNGKKNCFLFGLISLDLSFQNENNLFIIKDKENYSLAIITKDCETSFLKQSYSVLSLTDLTKTNNKSFDVSNYIMSLDVGSLCFYNHVDMVNYFGSEIARSLFNTHNYKTHTVVWPVFIIDKMSLVSVEFKSFDMQRIAGAHTGINDFYINLSDGQSKTAVAELSIFNSVVKIINGKFNN